MKNKTERSMLKLKRGREKKIRREERKCKITRSNYNSIETRKPKQVQARSDGARGKRVTR